jgi:hypothetical protein
VYVAKRHSNDLHTTISIKAQQPGMNSVDSSSYSQSLNLLFHILAISVYITQSAQLIVQRAFYSSSWVALLHLCISAGVKSSN